ncbi:uncharacterized protein LOC122140241 [Cyprinus carpio]|uniref:Uncharacterized protein LOC122140241 n=1 Tax=Cyprinus carpio TaxID=7962 RepID=A0A9Q9XBZ9_CYPCA|nr:uncharacterized protein LOC122140241 [Cyprinus carpio]
MTRPKFRPCPSCQTPNQASRKSCYVCFGSLSTKQKIKHKVVSLDSQWGQSVVNSRNTGRIIDSARIAVRKLDAVGYKPILFIGKQDKKASNKWVADIITYLQPTLVTRNFLEKMQRAYEFILTNATSTAQQLDNDIPVAEQHNSPSLEQCNGSILELESLTVERPECLTVKQESLTVERPECLTVKQESLTVERPECLTVKQESLTVERPECLAVKQESLTVERPECLAVKQESLTVERAGVPRSETGEPHRRAAGRASP